MFGDVHLLAITDFKNLINALYKQVVSMSQLQIVTIVDAMFQF